MGGKAIAKRWSDLIAYALFAPPIAVALLLPVLSPLNFISNRLILLPEWSLFGLAALLASSLALSFAAKRPRASLGYSLSQSVRFPPLWISVAVAISLVAIAMPNLVQVLSPLLDDLNSSKVRWDFCAITAWIAIWAAAAHIVAILFLQWGAFPNAGPEPQQSIQNPEDVLGWVRGDDKPISNPCADLFHRAAIAKRIAKRLLPSVRNRQASPTFLIAGARGSGKSSICQLLKHYLDNRSDAGSRIDKTRTVLFARLSAWPYTSASSLIQGVLEEIVSTIHDRVDAIGLAGIPSEYVRVVSTAVPTSLSSLLSPRRDSPHHIIAQLNHVLSAVDIVVCVWIDDLERFSPNRRRSTQPVSALLATFRGCDFLTFVLAVDSDCHRQLDRSKLATHIDLITQLSPYEIQTTIKSFFRGIEMGDSRDSLTSLPNWLLSPNPQHVPLLDAVRRILTTPRTLRAALRITDAYWADLKNEVVFEELFLVNVLRQSDLQLPKFHQLSSDARNRRVRVLEDVIVDNADWLREGMPQRQSDDREKLWLRELTTTPPTPLCPEGVILKYLFLDRGQGGPQSVRSPGPTDYLSRILSGEHSDRVADSTIKNTINEWRGSHVDAPSHSELVDIILHGEFGGAKAEQFLLAAQLSDSEIKSLVEEVLKRTIDDSELHNYQDDDECEFLITLARLLSDKDETWWEWIFYTVHRFTAEAISINLVLVNQIEYWLVPRLKREVGHRERLIEMRRKLAAAIRTGIISTYTSPVLDGSRLLIRAVPSRAKFIFSWIIQRLWDEPEFQTTRIELQLWRPFVDVLIDAARLAPVVVGQPFACMLSTAKFGKLEDEEHSDVDADRWSASFNEEFARTLLGDRFDAAMQVLAIVPLDGLRGQALACCYETARFARDRASYD